MPPLHCAIWGYRHATISAILAKNRYSSARVRLAFVAVAAKPAEQRSAVHPRSPVQDQLQRDERHAERSTAASR